MGCVAVLTSCNADRTRVTLRTVYKVLLGKCAVPGVAVRPRSCARLPAQHLSSVCPPGLQPHSTTAISLPVSGVCLIICLFISVSSLVLFIRDHISLANRFHT